MLKQFRPDFRPQYVLALDALRDEDREADVVPDQRSGAPERADGLGARRRARDPSGAQAPDRLSRRAAVRVLGRRTSSVAHGQGRGRRAGRGDAARALLRHLEVQPGDRPRLGDPRRLRLRDERVLEAHRLAGRRDRRDARNAVAVSSSGRRSRTGACGCATTTSSSCATASRSGRRSRSSAESARGSAYEDAATNAYGHDARRSRGRRSYDARSAGADARSRSL